METSPTPTPYYGLSEEGLTAEDWMAITRDQARSYARQARRLAREYPRPGSVVDFGCGDGRLLSELASLWPEDVEMHGVEIDPDLVREARHQFGRRNLRFCLAPAQGPPAPADLVISTYTAHHWTDLDAYLRALVGLTKPGGRIHIVDIDPDTLYSRLHASVWFLRLMRPTRADWMGYRHSRDHAAPFPVLLRALNALPGVTYDLRRHRGRVTARLRVVGDEIG